MDAQDFAYEAERIVDAYKTEQTRHEHLRGIYHAVFKAGYNDAMADLGKAVVAGAVFGKVALNGAEGADIAPISELMGARPLS